MLRFLLVAALWFFSFPLAILYHLLAALRRETPKTPRPARSSSRASSEARARLVAATALRDRLGEIVAEMTALDRSAPDFAERASALKARADALQAEARR